MKSKNIIIGIALLIIAFFGYNYFFNKKVVPVNFVTTTPQYGDIQKSITATGTLKPLDTVSVGSQISGVVKNIYVDFNDVVKKGELLAKVDPTIINAQVNAAKATVETAKANLLLQRSVFDRQNGLYNLGAISKADFQLALNQKNTALAAINSANAQLSIANRNLFYTNIYAPIDGTILNRNVSEGQTIAASLNAPTLFVIAKDLTKMQVRASVDEADIGDVKAGQKVSFTVDAFPNDTFNGSVLEVLLNSKTSANVVTYTTLINVENKDLRLKPGMTANIKIFTDENKNALLIPARALTFKPDSTQLKNYKIISIQKGRNHKFKHHKFNGLGGNEANGSNPKSYVWTIKGNTLTQKEIKVGITDDVNVRVTEGLSENDEVISNVIMQKSSTEDNANKSPFIPQMGQKPNR